MNKEDWRRAKAEVVGIEAERAELVAHTDDRYRSAYVRLEEIEDECPEIVAKCEGCSEPIFSDEPYCGGDTQLCLKCAPTYADLLANPDHFENNEGYPMPVAKAKAICDAHVASGGSLEDSIAT